MFRKTNPVTPAITLQYFQFSGFLLLQAFVGFFCGFGCFGFGGFFKGKKHTALPKGNKKTQPELKG